MKIMSFPDSAYETPFFVILFLSCQKDTGEGNGTYIHSACYFIIKKKITVNRLSMKPLVNSFFTLFLMAMLCSVSGSVRAQKSTCDPTTCTVVRSGKYSVELAGCDNYLDIYVLDTLGIPLKNTMIKGRVEFFYLDETSLMVPFRQFFRTNSLRAKIPCPGFYNCRVTLFIGTDSCEVYFDNECDLRAGL